MDRPPKATGAGRTAKIVFDVDAKVLGGMLGWPSVTIAEDPTPVPNYAKLFGHRPDVLAAWGQLIAAIRGHMEQRRYELVTIAAARALNSSY